MKTATHPRGSFSNATVYTLIAVGAACWMVPDARADIPGGTVVTGSLDVGTSSAKGGLKITGESGSTALPSLSVTGDGSVIFQGTPNVGSVPVLGSTQNAFLWYAKKNAIFMGLGSGFSDSQVGVNSLSLVGVASGSESIAIGKSSISNGEKSVTLGTSNTASSYSVAVGIGNSVSAGSAFGSYNTTNAGGVAVGFGNVSSGDYATAAGVGVEARAAYSVAMGVKNIAEGSLGDWVPSDPLFVLGNGIPESSIFRNAMVIQKDAVMKLYGTSATVPTIILDPTGTPKITIGGQPVVTGNSSGNLGIRTTPSATDYLTIGTASGAKEIVFTNAGTDSAEIMHLGNANLVLGTNNMARMTVTGGGTVGIGITSPNTAYQLDVANYSSLGGLRINGNDEANTFLNTNNKQISINASAGNGITVKTTGAVVVGEWNVAAQQKFNVMGKAYFSDWVGVGIGTPAAPLHATLDDANSATTSTALIVEHRTTGTAAPGIGTAIEFRGERGDGNVQNQTSKIVSLLNANPATTVDLWDMAFYTRNDDTIVESMRLAYNGNVGIGTSAPTAKLEVSGSMKVSGAVQFAKQGDIPMGEFGTNGD